MRKHAQSPARACQPQPTRSAGEATTASAPQAGHAGTTQQPSAATTAPTVTELASALHYHWLSRDMAHSTQAVEAIGVDAVMKLLAVLGNDTRN